MEWKTVIWLKFLYGGKQLIQQTTNNSSMAELLYEKQIWKKDYQTPDFPQNSVSQFLNDFYATGNL